MCDAIILRVKRQRREIISDVRMRVILSSAKKFPFGPIRSIVKFWLVYLCNACIRVTANASVVVQFYCPLFLGMVMYDNEIKTKENKI